MKRIYFLAFIIILISSALYADTAPGASEGEFGARFMWWRVPSIVEQLELTDDQRTRLEEIESHVRQKQIELRAAEKRARLELMRALEQETPTEAAVRAAVTKYNKARGDMMMTVMLAQVKARLVLTLPQRKKLKQLMAAPPPPPPGPDGAGQTR